MDIKEIRHKNLKNLLESRCGNNQAEFGRRTGLGGAYVYQLMSQRRPMGDRTSRKIENSFDLPRGWMDSIHSSNVESNKSEESFPAEKYALIPRYEVKTSAGCGYHNGDHVEISKTHAFRIDWIRKNNWREEDLCVVEASGHSMEPKISDGDVLLVNMSDKDFHSGKVYVLLFPGEGLRAKRVHRMADGRIKISSDNPDKAQFPDEFYSLEEASHLNIVGRVVQREGGV
ncbi:MAG: S24 family peptidase [Nitrospirota bacterium]|nr:S24 family peptidase [Nitrospirota bacterium]